MGREKFLLRCKSKESCCVLDSLTKSSTVYDLKIQIALIMDLDIHKIKVLCGYPRRAIDLNDESKKLYELSLQSGDTLIIEESSCSDDPTDKIPVATIAPVQTQNTKQQHLSEPSVLAVLPEGVLLQYTMPANNSCLFASTHFAYAQETLPNYEFMRKIVADAVAADPLTYCEAFLGKPNHEYCKWILQEEHWGGAIELSILSKHYGFEIVAIDMQNLHLHHFGEDSNYDHRIFLIYNGVHYDAMVLQPADPELPLQTVFPVENEVILQKAKDLIVEGAAKKQQQGVLGNNGKAIYICAECDRSLYNQSQVEEHAKVTKHINYKEG